MSTNGEGRALLADLDLDGFGAFSSNLFDGIRRMDEILHQVLVPTAGTGDDKVLRP
jgi:hypothetical protein